MIAVPLFAVLALAAPAKAESVDTIVAKHLEASGGVARLKALKAMRMKGEMTVRQGAAPLTGSYQLEMKRPRFYRSDFTLIGLNAVQAWDGTSGWTISPFAGDPNAHPMTPQEATDMAPRAEFDTTLLDYKARGTKVALVGTEDVDGAPAYKLKVTPKAGGERFVFLDRKTYLEVQREETRGTEVMQTRVGDYRKEGDLTFAHSFESGPKGGEKQVTLKITAVELDPQIDDARFKKPDTNLPVAPPIPPGMFPTGPPPTGPVPGVPPGMPGGPPTVPPAAPPAPSPSPSPSSR
jgi:hypothetical protein